MITNSKIISFTAIANANNLVASGAAGYIDYDITGLVPLTALVVLVATEVNAGAAKVGCREVGSSLDPGVTLGTGIWMQTLCGVKSGHIEVYRDAAQAIYYNVIGYFR